MVPTEPKAAARHVEGLWCKPCFPSKAELQNDGGKAYFSKCQCQEPCVQECLSAWVSVVSGCELGHVCVLVHHQSLYLCWELSELAMRARVGMNGLAARVLRLPRVP